MRSFVPIPAGPVPASPRRRRNLGAADPPGRALAPGISNSPLYPQFPDPRDGVIAPGPIAPPDASAPDVGGIYGPPVPPKWLTPSALATMTPEEAGPIPAGPVPPQRPNPWLGAGIAALGGLLLGGNTDAAIGSATGYLGGVQQGHERQVTDSMRQAEESRRLRAIAAEEEDRAARARHQAAVDAHLMQADQGDALELLLRGAQGLDDAGARAYFDLAERSGLMKRANVDPATLKDTTGAWSVGSLSKAARPLAPKPFDVAGYVARRMKLPPEQQKALDAAQLKSGQPGVDAIADLPTFNEYQRPGKFKNPADALDYDNLQKDRAQLIRILTAPVGQFDADTRKWASDALGKNEYQLQTLVRRSGGAGADLVQGGDAIINRPDMTPAQAANVQASKERLGLERGRAALAEKAQKDRSAQGWARIEQGDRRIEKMGQPKAGPIKPPGQVLAADQQLQEQVARLQKLQGNLRAAEAEETAAFAAWRGGRKGPDESKKAAWSAASRKKGNLEASVKQVQAEITRLRKLR